MKVLHVIPSVSPIRGGPSFAMRAMAESLGNVGLQIHIATTDDNGTGRLDVPLGTAVIDALVTTWYFPRQTRSYTSSWPLTSWLRRNVSKYDLVHIHGLFSYAALPAAYYAYRAHVPYIVRPLGTLNRWGMQRRRPWLKQLSFQLIERHILNRAAAVHYTSKQEQQEAQELGIKAASAVIPLGVDLPLEQQWPNPSLFLDRYPGLAERRLILFLSRLDPKKGLDLLLQAFALLHKQDPNISLVIAGEGEENFVSQLQREAERLGVAAAITWTGFLSGEIKRAALAAASLFVLPSYSENFGVAAIEALSAGLPVVLSNQVGVAQEIADAGAGIVVPCDAQLLAVCLEQLLSDAKRCQQMAIRSRQLAYDRFSTEATAGALVTLYEHILSSREVRQEHGDN